MIGTMSCVVGRRARLLALRYLGIALLAWGNATVSFAAALWGPNSTFEPFGDPAPSIQPYDKEFRWSSEMGGLEVQFDTTFIDFFGQGGVHRVTKGLTSWNNGVAAAGRNAFPAPPANKFDLESVAVHELGHALGLTHPDEADDPMAAMNPARNWQPTAGNVFPYLNAVSAAPGGGEVMSSTIGRGDVRRDLTADEVAGLNYLYDPANLNAKVGPEVAAMVPGAGIGGLALTASIGQDSMMVNDAIMGAGLGKNIDIFAVDFTGFVFPAPPPMGSGATEEMEVFKGTDGTTLAVTIIRFAYTAGTDGPGIIDGTPHGFGDPMADVFFAGVDIYFNTAVKLPPADGPGSGWYVPEPSTCLMFVIATTWLCVGRIRNGSRRTK